MASLPPRIGYGWLVLVASLVALALYGYATSTGLALTSDSYHYLYAAETLRQKGQLLMPHGEPMRAWPPLFPVVLSLIGEPSSVRWLNGAALVGALAAWCAVGRELLPASRRWGLPLLLALGSPTLVVSKFIWSEPLFNLLWASYFLVLLAWLRHGGWRLGILATLLGAVLPFQRIAGLFLVMGVGVGLLWPGTARLVRPRRWAQLAHVAAAAIGILLWQLRGELQSALASRAGLAYTYTNPLQILSEYGFVLGRWLGPLPVPSLTAVPIVAWVAVLVALLGLLWPRLATSHGTPATNGSNALASARILLAGLVLTVVILTASATYGRTGSGLFEAERYLTPLYPPVVLLVLLAWPANVRWAAKVGPYLLVAWVLYQGVRAGHNAQQLRSIPAADMHIHRHFSLPEPAALLPMPGLHR
ncbi:hypothetical protein GO988_18710 [Hymenobacter sp. HMF4947]|uniref:Glycosyltransferase RgtA/B/C/D-like domain-containing protein n=1 Tax=Hymenobacter ginkgonis TaxID=2682976 RepID=A0A7K1TIY2_9BACT|nr:hypothetical protein [Hymenobacter ginkgonis]MVN78367.1 hypothetical protein [Hymenobacter ginkgonis]